MMLLQLSVTFFFVIFYQNVINMRCNERNDSSKYTEIYLNQSKEKKRTRKLKCYITFFKLNTISSLSIEFVAFLLFIPILRHSYLICDLYLNFKYNYYTPVFPSAVHLTGLYVISFTSAYSHELSFGNTN